MAPERIRGPECLHRGNVRAQAGLDRLPRCLRWMGREPCRSVRGGAAQDDARRGQRNRQDHRGECQDRLRSHAVG